MENVWEKFWSKVSGNKDRLFLNDSSIFHYAVLEYLGYHPRDKLTVRDEKWLKNLDSNSRDYRKLKNFVEKRDAEYKQLGDVRERA